MTVHHVVRLPCGEAVVVMGCPAVGGGVACTGGGVLCEPSELLQCMLAMLCMPSWPSHLPSSIMRIIRRCCHVTALLHHSYACTSSRVAAAQMHPADVNDMAVPQPSFCSRCLLPRG